MACRLLRCDQNQSSGANSFPRETLPESESCLEEMMARTKSRAGSARATGARGIAGRYKTGGSTRRVSKSGGKRPGVTRKKGSAKQRKELRTRNVGKGRARGRQTGGGGKASSFTAQPIGRTLGVALPGESAPPGERGAWEFGKAKPS